MAGRGAARVRRGSTRPWRPVRRPGAAKMDCEAEPVFGQTVLAARTARCVEMDDHRHPEPRDRSWQHSRLRTPSGGRWSLRRVLQRPGRQRKRSSAKAASSRTSSSAPSSPPCCNRGVLRRGWRRGERPRAPPSERRPGDRQRSHLPGQRCRSRRRTTARNTPVGRSGGRVVLGIYAVHAEAGLGCKPRGRHAQLAGRSAGALRSDGIALAFDRLSLRCAGPRPAERGVGVDAASA